MENPWIIEDAFKPMFCDVVEFACVREGRKNRSSVRACVFPVEDVDPFVDSDVENNLKKIHVIVKKLSMDALGVVPKVGDVFKMANCESYGITSVELQHWDYVITARRNKC